MFYPIALLLISSLIFFAWCWRYKIRPLTKKSYYKNYYKNHPNGEYLKKCEILLYQLYDATAAENISKSERRRLNITEDAFIYGEIVFTPFFTLLDKVFVTSDEVFYDLGSGGGKAIFTAFLYGQFKKVCGIELLPGLCEFANHIKNDLFFKKNILQLKPEARYQIEIINNNFLNSDISDGDIIFINATCLSYPTWQTLLQKINTLKVGARVMVTTKKIELSNFNMVYQGITLMSWGLNSIHIYQKMA